jgi:hypothetical protein
MSIKIVTLTIDDAPPAAGTFSEPITPDFRDIIDRGIINLSVWQNPATNDPWDGTTITLQRRFPISVESPSVKTEWRDVLVFTSNSEQLIEEIEKGVQYRVGCKNLEYASDDDIDLRLSY